MILLRSTGLRIKLTDDVDRDNLSFRLNTGKPNMTKNRSAIRTCVPPPVFGLLAIIVGTICRYSMSSLLIAF